MALRLKADLPLLELFQIGAMYVFRPQVFPDWYVTALRVGFAENGIDFDCWVEKQKPVEVKDDNSTQQPSGNQ